MNRRVKYLSIAVGILLLAAAIDWLSSGSATDSAPANSTVAQASPATHPAVSDDSADSTLLPREYAILTSRNPFGGHGRASGPAASFVFRGVMQTGTEIAAFIEDMSTKRVLNLKAGDRLSAGRIKSIDLDALIYEADGDPRRIEVGQNLYGEASPPPAPPASQPSAPTPAPADRAKRPAPMPPPPPE